MELAYILVLEASFCGFKSRAPYYLNNQDREGSNPSWSTIRPCGAEEQRECLS